MASAVSTPIGLQEIDPRKHHLPGTGDSQLSSPTTSKFSFYKVGEFTANPIYLE